MDAAKRGERDKEMMYHEFYNRTKVEVDQDEYSYVEDSYYEFDGNKDEFCKAWLKDYLSGAWKKELRLRKIIARQKADFNEKLAEKEENLDFYRKRYQHLHEAHCSVTIRVKSENFSRKYDDVTICYIDNGTGKFYNVIKDTWMTSFLVDNIESLEIKII